MKKMNILALSLATIVTALYCMERNEAGEGQDMPPLEQLTLNENEQEQPQPPARPIAPIRVPLGHIGGTLPPYSPVGSRSNSPYTSHSPSSQFTRIRPIGQSPATVPTVAPVAQNIAPVTPNIAPVDQDVAAVRGTNTPNAVLTNAAEEALNALDRGDAAEVRAALERIRAFLPQRSGRNSENRNPDTSRN